LVPRVWNLGSCSVDVDADVNLLCYTSVQSRSFR
jgi:hypothetical protein